MPEPWVVYECRPLYQSEPPTDVGAQGSASLTASLHPGLRSLTPWPVRLNRIVQEQLIQTRKSGSTTSLIK